MKVERMYVFPTFKKLVKQEALEKGKTVMEWTKEFTQKQDIEKFLNNARGTNCAWSQAQILPIHIRRNIKLAEAPSYGKTIFEYEPNCHGAEDYRKVAEFIHTQSQRAPQPSAQFTAADKSADSPPIASRSIAQKLFANPPHGVYTKKTRPRRRRP